MPADCLFCKIGRGEIPARALHDDAKTFAFLDIHPLAKGHALVIPKAHYERVADMPRDEATALFAAIHGLVPKLQRAADATAMTVAFNDGPASGQEVPHVHCHLVPRREGDGAGPIHAMRWPKPAMTDAELDELAKRVRG